MSHPPRVFFLFITIRIGLQLPGKTCWGKEIPTASSHGHFLSILKRELSSRGRGDRKIVEREKGERRGRGNDLIRKRFCLEVNIRGGVCVRNTDEGGRFLSEAMTSFEDLY